MPLTPQQFACLDAMGIEVWQRRELFTQTDSTAQPAPTADDSVAKNNHVAGTAEVSTPSAKTTPVPAGDWQALQQQVSQCTRCELHQTRTQTVFGVGHQQADILIIGEAPGADEDRQGEPFVGRAGQLLNEMLKAIGLSRQHVYIANVLKCRPPNNRDPKPEEAALCADFLNRQIALIQPKVIVALGRIAAQRLLNTTTSLGKLRNSVHTYPATNTPVIITYHPAYLLRAPAEKRKAWEDLLFIVDTVNR